MVDQNSMNKPLKYQQTQQQPEMKLSPVKIRHIKCLYTGRISSKFHC